MFRVSIRGTMDTLLESEIFSRRIRGLSVRSDRVRGKAPCTTSSIKKGSRCEPCGDLVRNRQYDCCIAMQIHAERGIADVESAVIVTVYGIEGARMER